MKASAHTYRGWKQRQTASRAITDHKSSTSCTTLQQPDEKTGRPKPEVLYGWRKIRAWLQRHGFPDVSEHTVNRLMRDARMNGLVRGRRTVTTIRAKDKVLAKDLLNRNFFTDAPDKAWVTDFTYVPTKSGFTYASFVIDLFSRRSLPWASSTSHDSEFVEEALRMAILQRWHGSESRKSPIQGTIHHSDACSGYTSQRYTLTLAEEGLIPSIGTIGDAFDNAAAETVMGLLKNEAVARESPFRQGPLATKADVDDVVVDWVHWYNHDRLHWTLGYRSPVEFEDLYYDETTGALPDVVASKLAA